MFFHESWIYKSTSFFSRNFMFHILEGCKVSFSVTMNSYIGIFDLIRKLLPCRKTKQRYFWEKKIVHSGIVKTFDELNLNQSCPDPKCVNQQFPHLFLFLHRLHHYWGWPSNRKKKNVKNHHVRTSALGKKSLGDNS